MNIASRQNLWPSSIPYIPLYGIKSDGTSYCALEQNINASYGRIVVDFTVTSYFAQNVHAFGGHGIDNRNHCVFHTHDNTNYGLFCFGSYSDNTSTGVLSLNTRYHLDMYRDSSGGQVVLNDRHHSQILSDQTINNTSKFLIFRANANTSSLSPATSFSMSNIVIHSMQIWFGDEQVADLVPCKNRKTNEICFFNAINHQFVKNIAGGNSTLIAVEG